MDVLFARFRFTLRLEASIADPFALFALKGSFPSVFRSAVCPDLSPCKDCWDQESCPYFATFSQMLAPDPEAVRRHQKPSLPFVFQVPVLPERCQAGQVISFNLVLIGTAVNHAAVFCRVLVDLFADRSRPLNLAASLIRIDSVDCSQYLLPVYTQDAPTLLEQFALGTLGDLLALHTLAPDRVHIRIETPLRCVSSGRLLAEFSFSPFIRSLLRRVSSLAYYYCGTTLPLDYPFLASASTSLVSVADSVRWHHASPGGVAGLRGRISLQGDLAEFYPVLLMGELVNCGKDASYGRGQFLLVSAEDGD